MPKPATPTPPTASEIEAVKVQLFNEGLPTRSLICRARELMRDAGFIPVGQESPLSPACLDLSLCLQSHRRAA
jgi:hypothetical protein